MPAEQLEASTVRASEVIYLDAMIERVTDPWSPSCRLQFDRAIKAFSAAHNLDRANVEAIRLLANAYYEVNEIKHTSNDPFNTRFPSLDWKLVQRYAINELRVGVHQYLGEFRIPQPRRHALITNHHFAAGLSHTRHLGKGALNVTECIYAPKVKTSIDTVICKR